MRFSVVNILDNGDFLAACHMISDVTTCLPAAPVYSIFSLELLRLPLRYLVARRAPASCLMPFFWQQQANL